VSRERETHRPILSSEVACSLSTSPCIIAIVPADVSIRVLFKPRAVRRGVPVEKREVCQKSQARYCV
jgi:hypothetical protein